MGNARPIGDVASFVAGYATSRLRFYILPSNVSHWGRSVIHRKLRNVTAAILYLSQQRLPLGTLRHSSQATQRHGCGKPLAPTAGRSGDSARIRASTKDPDILAAIDGKCPGCGTWVVRDAPRNAA